MITLPKTGTRTRFLLVVMGAVIVFWMGLEDHQGGTPAILGWLGAIILISIAILRRVGGISLPTRSFFMVMMLWGASVGAGASVFSAGLMLLKTGWHGHIVPDYSRESILGILSLLPIWSLAGFFFGIAGALTIHLWTHSLNSEN